VEIARKGIFKESPHNSHPCEFTRTGFIQESMKWNSYRIVSYRIRVEKCRLGSLCVLLLVSHFITRNSNCEERNLHGTELARNGVESARNANYVCLSPVP